MQTQPLLSPNGKPRKIVNVGGALGRAHDRFVPPNSKTPCWQCPPPRAISATEAPAWPELAVDASGH
eukprot:3008928-Lingulodinium_polyedra.AAC.1